MAPAHLIAKRPKSGVENADGRTQGDLINSRITVEIATSCGASKLSGDLQSHSFKHSQKRCPTRLRFATAMQALP
jgi:hypothetical protein